jgi:hypothetical protein
MYSARDGESGPRQFQGINEAACQYVHRGTGNHSTVFGDVRSSNIALETGDRHPGCLFSESVSLQGAASIVGEAV